MSKVEYELLEPEERQSKWEPVSHRYSIEGSKSPINEVVLDVHPSGSQDIIIGLDVPTNKKDHVIQTTKTLLGEAGYEAVKFNTYNSSSFSAKISVAKDEVGVLGVVSALSNDVKTEDGVTAYAVLPREVVRDIAIMEMNRLAEGNDHLYGSFVGGYEGELANYVDVVTQDTQAGQLLGIDFIRENGVFAEVTEITTELSFNDSDVQSRTVAALQKAGVSTKVENGMVTAGGTIDIVSPVMARAGLLPNSLLPAIGEQLKVLRPEAYADFDIGEAFQ